MSRFPPLVGFSEGVEMADNDTQAILRSVLVMNQYLWDRVRSGWRGGDPRRSIEQECGHPEITWTAQEYQAHYDTSDIAAKVVECWPRLCWQANPTVYEAEATKATTPFEVVLDAVGRGLSGFDSLYKEEQGSLIQSYWEQADILQGIGRYAVMLLGFDDGAELDEPVEDAEYAEGSRKLLYVRVFPEAYAPILESDTDPASERYRQPVFYSLTMDGSETAAKVHWSRVVHVSEGDVYHDPRMQQVIPRILDVKKLLGGSAEMFWKAGTPMYTLEIPPQLAGLVDQPTASQEQEVKDAFERMMMGLQRETLLKWLTAKQHAPGVSDPSPQLKAQYDAIAMRLDISNRVFMGSERGELASSQDAKKDNKSAMRRQAKVLTPRLIVPFVTRLISAGVLPRPEQVRVFWPPMDQLGEQEKAAKALTLSQALAAWKASGEALPLLEYLTMVWGWEEDEAKMVAAAAEKAKEEREKKAMEMMQQQAKMQPPAPPNRNGTPFGKERSNAAAVP